jgi:hypothetical protein
MGDLLPIAAAKLGDPSGLFVAAKLFIHDKFGTPGLVAAGILLVSIVALCLVKTVKLSFDVVRYVVVPSVAVTFIATCFLPYSFVYILPVTVAFFSIALVFKG